MVLKWWREARRKEKEQTAGPNTTDLVIVFPMQVYYKTFLMNNYNTFQTNGRLSVERAQNVIDNVNKISTVYEKERRRIESRFYFISVAGVILWVLFFLLHLIGQFLLTCYLPAAATAFIYFRKVEIKWDKAWKDRVRAVLEDHNREFCNVRKIRWHLPMHGCWIELWKDYAL